MPTEVCNLQNNYNIQDKNMLFKIIKILTIIDKQFNTFVYFEILNKNSLSVKTTVLTIRLTTAIN